MDSQIERIKRELSLERAWKILDMPGEPALNRDLRSPFRQDKNPSFRLYQARDHVRYHDHGTGLGGDVLDLWAAAKEISIPEAITQIEAYLGDMMPLERARKPVERVSAPRQGFVPPSVPWRPPGPDDCRGLARLRKLDPAAFDMAGRLGVLKIGMMREWPSWFITDQSGSLAESRRMDGLLYPEAPGFKARKGWALKGSHKDWPIGLTTLQPEFNALKNILLVEGGPDYFAGLQLALNSEISFRPAAMLGAGVAIGPQAREHFRGAHVLIIPHNDRSGAGEKAARAWATQIMSLGVKNCFIQRLPIVCDDLNDFLIQRPDEGQKLLKGFQ
jgi:hypothetical protein